MNELTRSAVVGVDDAVTALVALGADAVIRSVGVAAGGTVSAWRRHHALVHVLVAQPSGVSHRTSTREVQEVRRRRALGAMETLVRRARIQLVLAVPARVRQFAYALVIVDQVDAGTAILTGRVGAVVDVRLAIDTRITGQTLAAVAIQSVLADATVLAGIRAALVDVGLASLATVAGQTMADELVHAVFASATVNAWIRGALVHVAQATRIVVATRTLAAEAVDQVDAASAIGARI